MNSAPPSVPADRSDAFARLAARDHAARHAVRAAVGRWQAQQARAAIDALRN